MRRHVRGDVLWAGVVLVVALLAAAAIAGTYTLRSEFDASQERSDQRAGAIEVLREQLLDLGEVPDAGPPGSPGSAGGEGDAGPRGFAGRDGVDGLTPLCLSTPTLCVGAAGAPGGPGADSTVPGPAGADSHVPGPAGVDGRDGADSTVPGPQGPAGADGAQGEPGPDVCTANGGTWTEQDPPGPNNRQLVCVLPEDETVP